MKIFAFAAIAALSAVEATEQASIHLRIHDKGGCTITNESQCNGQNWTGSTCCADSNYECRWSDDGQNVQRCQKKKTTGTTGTTGGGGTVGDWGACTGGLKCKNSGSVCVKHSNYYSQCKPATLPAGELCGQNDGTNVWKYDKCPSNQKCAALGSDFRCTNKKHKKKSTPNKDETCTIESESQCDGQNWTFSTCCKDPSYECRKSDDGQDVKRCQKIKDYTETEDSEDYSEDDSTYTDDDGSYIYVDEGDYTSFVDDYGDCTKLEVGCSNPTSWCIYHSVDYAQCKPETLPPGELCGQDDGTNVWYYPYCQSGESCEPKGTDYRCTKAKKHHHHHRQHRA
uniref:CBP7 n=1 Tax=Phytophthora capsici TaxID=4784 RepID=A0A8E5NIL4_PHYCP|nr:CBP7 [Phytophthora capsici]